MSPEMTAPERARPRTDRISAVGVTLLMGIVVAVAFYGSNPTFAARVDGAAADLQARVSAMLAQ